MDPAFIDKHVISGIEINSTAKISPSAIGRRVRLQLLAKEVLEPDTMERTLTLSE
jgi:hypothetical protein